MLPPPQDRTKLAEVLAQLGSAVEEQLLSGLTTASTATRQTLAGAMQEAARFRLLRLGSTLRTATEELSRFTNQDAAFSRRRLTFFLSRAWLLSRGLSQALRTADEKEYERLNWSPPTQPLPKVDVVCIGIAKRVAAGAFVAFEFRLRSLTDAAPVKAGQRLSWSIVFPIKPGLDIPLEAFLHLPHKCKVTPFVFLERKILRIERADIVVDESAGSRITLTEQSTVLPGTGFKEWDRFQSWSPESAIERIRRHSTGPLDLDTELQEEIVLHDYSIGTPTDGDSPGQTVFPITMGPLTFSATMSSAAEDQVLREGLVKLSGDQPNKPPLYGLLHYEKCRLAFQPLTAFRPEPDYLTITKENIKKAAVLKAMSFT